MSSKFLPEVLVEEIEEATNIFHTGEIVKDGNEVVSG